MMKVDRELKQTQVLVITTTRELAIQTVHVMRWIASDSGILVAYGITDTTHFRIEQHHIVVGTPGKLRQLLSARIIPLERLRLVVCDEADALLGNSYEDVDLIFECFALIMNWYLILSRMIPRSIQVLLFSATFKKEVRKIAFAKATNADVLSISTKSLSLSSVCQMALCCSTERNRYEILKFLYAALKDSGQTIVFVNVLDSRGITNVTASVSSRFFARSTHFRRILCFLYPWWSFEI